MSENSRVNGYDTKAPTRVDTIPSRKAVRGSRSTTFTDNPEKKQKINLYVDSDDRDWLEQLEEMLRNPLFAISKLQGAGISEKQLIHSYRFQHSIGDIDFINLEHNQVRTKIPPLNIPKKDIIQLINKYNQKNIVKVILLILNILKG